MNNSPDDFYEPMLDVANDAMRKMSIRIRELNIENSRLIQELHSYPAEMWRLQEQITTLELILDSAMQDNK